MRNRLKAPAQEAPLRLWNSFLEALTWMTTSFGRKGGIKNEILPSSHFETPAPHLRNYLALTLSTLSLSPLPKLNDDADRGADDVVTEALLGEDGKTCYSCDTCWGQIGVDDNGVLSTMDGEVHTFDSLDPEMLCIPNLEEMAKSLGFPFYTAMY
ncbi:hypothetical protein PIB30_080815 [Stylosanthes scabra]|uniref:Uncharacterized protein n=1 Tax=Stylosanthes scabra TaxID=79078 RepID=A0ABU6QU02_9FABA|nr:hypothetical protein [Stylosanthes scabra]